MVDQYLSGLSASKARLPTRHVTAYVALAPVGLFHEVGIPDERAVAVVEIVHDEEPLDIVACGLLVDPSPVAHEHPMASPRSTLLGITRLLNPIQIARLAFGLYLRTCGPLWVVVFSSKPMVNKNRGIATRTRAGSALFGEFPSTDKSGSCSIPEIGGASLPGLSAAFFCAVQIPHMNSFVGS